MLTDKPVNRIGFSITRYNCGVDILVMEDPPACIMIKVINNPEPEESVKIPLRDFDWLMTCLQQAKEHVQKMDKGE